MFVSRTIGVVYFDALRVKIRDEGMVRNKAVYLAIGIDCDGQIVQRADGHEKHGARGE